MTQDIGLLAGEKVPLAPRQLALMNAWWRAANYLSVGQVYLLANPLLRQPLKLEHVKPRLLGHWGTTPGLNFIYVHLNRIIKERDANVLFIAGPGHGAPGVVANTWLEGTYSELYPAISQDEAGMARLFKQFSFPGGIPSHASPTTPGSIHEGGELGYSLLHAYGAVFDNPDLIAACVVGDGEAETGPLATSWHSNKFLNPATDGAVLPILHLNGYKIANPTILARISSQELTALMLGYGHAPIFVEGHDPAAMHQLMAAAMDKAFAQIREIQKTARDGRPHKRALWPMIVLRSPKGLDRSQDRRWPQDRRILAFASGAIHPGEARTSGASGRLDAQLSPGGTVRCGRPSASGNRGPGANGGAPDERQSARQWRRADAPVAAAGFPELCRYPAVSRDRLTRKRP